VKSCERKISTSIKSIKDTTRELAKLKSQVGVVDLDKIKKKLEQVDKEIEKKNLEFNEDEVGFLYVVVDLYYLFIHICLHFYHFIFLLKQAQKNTEMQGQRDTLQANVKILRKKLDEMKSKLAVRQVLAGTNEKIENVNKELTIM